MQRFTFKLLYCRIIHSSQEGKGMGGEGRKRERRGRKRTEGGRERKERRKEGEEGRREGKKGGNKGGEEEGGRISNNFLKIEELE